MIEQDACVVHRQSWAALLIATTENARLMNQLDGLGWRRENLFMFLVSAKLDPRKDGRLFRIGDIHNP